MQLSAKVKRKLGGFCALRPPTDWHSLMAYMRSNSSGSSWSGGKDSALALHEAQEDFEIVILLTTVTEGYDRISVHGVRTTLLERQADSGTPGNADPAR